MSTAFQTGTFSRTLPASAFHNAAGSESISFRFTDLLSDKMGEQEAFFVVEANGVEKLRMVMTFSQVADLHSAISSYINGA